MHQATLFCLLRLVGNGRGRKWTEMKGGKRTCSGHFTSTARNLKVDSFWGDDTRKIIGMLEKLYVCVAYYRILLFIAEARFKCWKDSGSEYNLITFDQYYNLWKKDSHHFSSWKVVVCLIFKVITILLKFENKTLVLSLFISVYLFYSNLRVIILCETLKTMSQNCVYPYYYLLCLIHNNMYYENKCMNVRIQCIRKRRNCKQLDPK